MMRYVLSAAIAKLTIMILVMNEQGKLYEMMS